MKKRTYSGDQLTPSSWRLSSLWRGITVTNSISQRKATSDGVKPGGRGSAMVDSVLLSAIIGEFMGTRCIVARCCLISDLVRIYPRCRNVTVTTPEFALHHQNHEQICQG